MDPLVWARGLNAALFGCCVALVAFWVAARTGSRIAAAVAGLMIGFAPPLVYVSSLALTELPFIAAVLASLRALDAWLQQPTRRNLVLCTAAAALACLIRYQGLALVATIGLVIALLGAEPLRTRLKLALAVTTSSVLPLAAWLIRNVLLTGQALGPRLASDYALSAAAADLGRNAMSWLVPWRVLLVHPYAGLALLVLLCLGIVAITVRDRQGAGAVIVCVTFAAAFAMMMLAAVTRTAMDPLADRILSPMYAPLIVAAVIAATIFLREARPATRRSAATAVVVVTSAALLGRTLPDAVESWKQGPGGAAHSNFNTDAWKSSPTLLWARDNVRGLAFASSPAALFLVGRVDSRPMPRKHARRAPTVPMDRLSDLHRDVSNAGAAFLVVTREHVPSHTFSLHELSRVFVLEVAAVFADGAVYRMLAKDVDPRPHELGAEKAGEVR